MTCALCHCGLNTQPLWSFHSATVISTLCHCVCRSTATFLREVTHDASRLSKGKRTNALNMAVDHMRIYGCVTICAYMIVWSYAHIWLCDYMRIYGCVIICAYIWLCDHCAYMVVWSYATTNGHLCVCNLLVCNCLRLTTSVFMCHDWLSDQMCHHRLCAYMRIPFVHDQFVRPEFSFSIRRKILGIVLKIARGTSPVCLN